MRDILAEYFSRLSCTLVILHFFLTFLRKAEATTLKAKGHTRDIIALIESVRRSSIEVYK